MFEKINHSIVHGDGEYRKVNLGKVSWPIYVNVDSPNLGFPYFNFLGGTSEKKHPVYLQTFKVVWCWMRVDPTPYWHNLVQEDVPWTRSWSSSRWSIWSVLGAGRNTTGGASPIACIPTCTQSTHNCTSLRTLCVRDTLYSLWDESAEFGLMWGQLGGGWGGVRGGREGEENQEKTNIFCFKIFPVVCKSNLLWPSLLVA